MMKLAILVVAALCASARADNWAVLVAGSATWSNYRHQADIYHAYQILSSHGIPDDHIIMMHENDIANDRRNPTPGQIINVPNGPDVYKGVLLDYVKPNVTPDQFLAVITGDAGKTDGRKVLQSTSDDHVFIYFADHGGPGSIAFPDPNWPNLLHADDLNKAIQTMRAKNMFKQLTIYVEACESGSMFDNILATDIDVYAVTAANPSQSSYAYFYDSKRGTYLGDEFSVRWMCNSDNNTLSTYTLGQQYDAVSKLVRQSEVCAYGSVSEMQAEAVGVFQGGVDPGTKAAPGCFDSASVSTDRVDSRDAPLEAARRALREETDPARLEERKAELRALLMDRRRAQHVELALAERAVGKEAARVMLAHPVAVRDWECYRGAIQAYRAACGEFSDYSIRNLGVLARLCEARVPVHTIAHHAKAVCGDGFVV